MDTRSARFLFEHTEQVTVLRGVGVVTARALARLGIETLADLVSLAPRRYEDRSQIVSLVEAVQRGEGLVLMEVIAHEFIPFRRSRALKIVVEDEASRGSLLCYGRNFLARSFPVGSRILVWGQFALKYGEIYASSFDAELVSDDAGAETAGILPVYPLTEGLSQNALRGYTRDALRRIADRGVRDPLPINIRNGLPDAAGAIADLHYPPSLDAAETARRRLVIEELFLFQLELAREALARRTSRRKARPARRRSLRSPVLAALPFSLTNDQKRVVAEIESDLDGPHPMSRLLQGDVGSGKTLVAVLAALVAIERGEQVALVVPTELLARQHARYLSRVLSPTDVRIALVLGSLTDKQRNELYPRITDGSADLVVGTHALFSESLHFANLSLVVVDEQHRFGVDQRAALGVKGTDPDFLLMSATPIPRSLALTAFGDSDISTIRELPPGRKPIETHLARMGNEERVYQFIERRLDEGRQAYCVYPAIDDGTARALRSAEKMGAELARRFPHRRVGILHSRLEEEERDRVMTAFVTGDIDILTATSVVEVGVDVPNATVMVIEHAELFGLAALHQLRGRVGRGDAQSFCILVYDDPLTETAKERLRAIFETTDGFRIAEDDLRIRGPGELSGTKQAGFLKFRFADYRRDIEEMILAREQVRTVLEFDAGLLNAENGDLREYLRHKQVRHT